MTIITYNKEGVVTEHPDDKWALRECFTCKLPMTGVDDLAKYVDYPICKMLITLDPARRDEVWAAGKKQFDGRIDCTPPARSLLKPYRWALPRTAALPPFWSTWALAAKT